MQDKSQGESNTPWVTYSTYYRSTCNTDQSVLSYSSYKKNECVKLLWLVSNL